MAWDRTKTAQERGYGKDWLKLRKVILKRDDYLCQACLRQDRLTPLCVKPFDHAVDHITLKARGGTDAPSNLQSLCFDCHEVKSDTDMSRNAGKMDRADGWSP
jgi:5-methylcytosine-specific restriction protein A